MASSSASSSAISAAACANADCCCFFKADRVVILYCWPNDRLLRCGVMGPMPLPSTAFCCCGCYPSYCSYYCCYYCCSIMESCTDCDCDRNKHI